MGPGAQGYLGMGNLLPFDACWARYGRADEHRTRLPSIWNDYIADHPFDFSLTHRGEGVHVLEAFEKWSMPADFVLELGEWLYQVRSCLDFIVWATAVYDSGESPAPDEDGSSTRSARPRRRGERTSGGCNLSTTITSRCCTPSNPSSATRTRTGSR